MVAVACAHIKPSKWWSQLLTTLPGLYRHSTKLSCKLCCSYRALREVQLMLENCTYFLNSTGQQLRDRQKISTALSLPLLPCRAEKTKNLQGFLGTSRAESDHKNKFLQQKDAKTGPNTTWVQGPSQNNVLVSWENLCKDGMRVIIQPMIRKTYVVIWKVALALLCPNCCSICVPAEMAEIHYFKMHCNQFNGFWPLTPVLH